MAAVGWCACGVAAGPAFACASLASAVVSDAIVVGWRACGVALDVVGATAVVAVFGGPAVAVPGGLGAGVADGELVFGVEVFEVGGGAGAAIA